MTFKINERNGWIGTIIWLLIIIIFTLMVSCSPKSAPYAHKYPNLKLQKKLMQATTPVRK